MGQSGVRTFARRASRECRARVFRSCRKCRMCWRRFRWALLASMISKTIFAISMEESRFTLNGSLLLLKNNGLAMVATDGHRLAMVENTVDLPGVTSSVSGAAAAQGDGRDSEAGAGCRARMPSMQFSGDENHLFFQLGERLLLSRKLTGNFPDFERVLPKDHPHSVALDREELREVHRARVAVFRRAVARHPDARAGRRTAHSFVAFGNRRERREHSGGIRRRSRWRSDSMPATCWIFCAPSNEAQVAFHFKDPHSAGELRPAGDGDAELQVSLRHHADADLSDPLADSDPAGSRRLTSLSEGLSYTHGNKRSNSGRSLRFQ